MKMKMKMKIFILQVGRKGSFTCLILPALPTLTTAEKKRRNKLSTMPIDLYYAPHSPPCRSVLMVAEALSLQLRLKPMNIEHPEFVEINPQHTIPTIVDNGFILWESRAIITYLVSKYRKGSSLYPEDPGARALVDQRLYFDIATLYQRIADYVFPQMLEGKSPDEAKLKKLEEALEFLETFLKGRQYVAGSNLTVADYSIVSGVSNFSFFDIDISKYPNIKAWFERMKTAPGYNKNEEGIQAFAALLETFKNNKPS